MTNTYYIMTCGANPHLRQIVSSTTFIQMPSGIRDYFAEERTEITKTASQLPNDYLRFRSKTRNGIFQVVPWCPEAILVREDAWLKLDPMLSSHLNSQIIYIESDDAKKVQSIPNYYIIYPKYTIECNSKEYAEFVDDMALFRRLKYITVDASRVPGHIYGFYCRFCTSKIIVNNLLKEGLMKIGFKEYSFRQIGEKPNYISVFKSNQCPRLEIPEQ
jgi:hypothetical protein